MQEEFERACGGCDTALELSNLKEEAELPLEKLLERYHVSTQDDFGLSSVIVSGKEVDQAEAMTRMSFSSVRNYPLFLFYSIVSCSSSRLNWLVSRKHLKSLQDCIFQHCCRAVHASHRHWPKRLE